MEQRMIIYPTKTLLTTTSLVTVAFILTTVVMGLVCSAVAAPTDGKIAVVNNTTVSRQDLDREMKMYALKLNAQGRPISDQELKRYEGNFRETLINSVLLLQQSEADGIKPKESQVTKSLNEFKASFKNEKDYQNELKQMGFTEKELFDWFKDKLTIEAVFEKNITLNIPISDKQIRDFYDKHPEMFRQPERVKASHILIKVAEDADEAKKEKALASIKSLKQRIDEGEPFANLAMEYSDCPSKAKGGDLGFFSREQMVQPFSEAAFTMQPGQVSDVVTTQFGYHLIRVTERQEAQMLAFSDVKEDIANHLRREQKMKKIGDYIEKIKKNADIQRFGM
jgi:peptidyl-prolyl cis-trans isomerase C